MRNDFSAAEIVHCPGFIHSIRQYIGCIFPYELFYCGFGCLENGRLRVLKLIHDNFPLDYFRDLGRADGSFSSPIVDKWHEAQRPVIFESARDAAQYPPEWVAVFDKHQLRNMVAHGKADMANGFFSSFSFYRLSATVTQLHAQLLELLVPHLHDALLVALGPALLDACERKELRLPLSTEQQHILYWMQQGKTDWETSRILGLNERTVKYHVKRILTKLNATNRAHAVGKALDLRPFAGAG